MARKNRLVVGDGCYNITARIANKAFLLRNPAFRSRIVDWIYGIAGFAGIEVDAWCIMENHLHLCVRVPPVPEKYWFGNNATQRTTAQGTVPGQPNSAAFSMRPRECRAPRWTPDVTESVPDITPTGDKPSEEAVRTSVAEGVPLVILPRPETGFTMTDEEMIDRLRMLYAHHSHGAEKIAKRWHELRSDGGDDIVEAEKDAFCRRMYNVSQYMKTLKQRISEVVNRETGHEGTLWGGRFYSALIGDTSRDSLMVAAYLAWNPVKAGIVGTTTGWAWSSYAAACDTSSPWHEQAKAGYERRFHCPWAETRSRLEALFAEKTSSGYDSGKDMKDRDGENKDPKATKRRPTVGQLIKTSSRMFERGGYISQDLAFAERIERGLTRNFPGPSRASIRFFAQFQWRQNTSPCAA